MAGLRCYAWGDDGDWEAICIDLDLAVQADTVDEVKAALNAAIRDYVETAKREAPDTARRLLSRRAPWHVRFGLQAAYFISRLVHADEREGHAGRQSFHCPA